MNPVGVFHVVCAVSSMVLGALIFSIEKGTRLHMLLGRVYVVSMLGLNITALLIYRLFGGFGPFHILALVSLMALLAGYAAVWFRQPADRWLANHYRAMAWSYVGLLAAAVSEAIVRIDFLRHFIDGWMNFGIAVFVASFVVCFVGGWLISRSEQGVLSKVKHIRSG